MAAPEAKAMEGRIPIVVDGKIIGGIGVSGVDLEDDAQIARAGANAIRVVIVREEPASGQRCPKRSLKRKGDPDLCS
jgi:hypothetical protein